MSKIAVIIVAAGSGQRMNSDIPKQFLPILGEPILVRNIKSIHAMLPMAGITVVLSANEVDRWSHISRDWGVDAIHRVCIGGATRFESVRNAVSVVGECDYIAVHDGVRPLFTRRMIDEALACVELHGSAIPAIDVIDSIRVVEPSGDSHIIDRTTLKAIQTPQWFDSATLRSSYSVEYNAGFTDDASVVESCGYGLTLCAGDIRNIKITTPNDIIIAEEFLKI